MVSTTCRKSQYNEQGVRLRKTSFQLYYNSHICGVTRDNKRQDAVSGVFERTGTRSAHAQVTWGRVSDTTCPCQWGGEEWPQWIRILEFCWHFFPLREVSERPNSSVALQGFENPTSVPLIVPVVTITPLLLQKHVVTFYIARYASSMTLWHPSQPTYTFNEHYKKTDKTWPQDEKWKNRKSTNKSLRWGWVLFISYLQKDFRKDPRVERKFCGSLLTTKFVVVAPIGVVISIWNLSW